MTEKQKARDEEAQKMRKAYELGHTVEAIAQAANLSKQAVYSRLKRSGCIIKDRRHHDQSPERLTQAERIRRMYESGMSQQAIAQQLHLCRRTVRNRLEMVGVAPEIRERRRPWGKLNSLPRAMKGAGY